MDREKVSHWAAWANIGTFVLTVAIIALMVRQPQTAAPSQAPNWGAFVLNMRAMPSVLAASLLLAAILNFFAYRGGVKTKLNSKTEIVGELETCKKNLAEASRHRDHFQQEYAIAANKILQLEKEVSARIKLPLMSLEADALYMSSDLLNFMKELGPPPPLKYTTANFTESLASPHMKELIIAEDIDFAEACEYYNLGGARSPDAEYEKIMEKWKQKYPWFQKMEAGYALRFRGRVETLRNRFLEEGVSDDGVFRLRIEHRDGLRNISTIAAKFWECAYRGLEKRTAHIS